MSLFRSDLYAKHSMILDRKAFRRKWLELEPEKRAVSSFESTACENIDRQETFAVCFDYLFDYRLSGSACYSLVNRATLLGVFGATEAENGRISCGVASVEGKNAGQRE